MDLEQRLKGAQVRWVDRDGPHVGSWSTFRGWALSFYGPLGERVAPKDCPLMEFDMDQLDALNLAQQMAVGLLLQGLGFPAMELRENVWHSRHGLVRWEEPQE